MVSNISVIGGGLMGHGIALTFARAGYQVNVQEPSAETRDTLTSRMEQSLSALGCESSEIAQALSNTSTHAELSTALTKETDLVVEAAPEKLALKQQLFSQVEALVSDTCLLTSNTSALPISKIMENVSLQERALGTHWWNPPHFIPLVEVIRTPSTSDAAMDAVVAVLERSGKKPVRVEKDVPGFIGNRLQHALWREAISIVEQGICDAESVDTVVKESFGRRLAVLGPLENADLVTTDLALDIHKTLLSEIDSRPGPSPYLERLVQEKKSGMAAGEGFRQWTPESAQTVRDRLARHLVLLDTILER
ncbi:MAG: 3-hydroxyacyl-CoA dehydrogenase family protein [Gammaproteobacteria bacterium]|nr:3-hydroxyacyl-CoA dehydrogenase family protein [Gammaproteobacteria bacterium]